jgi:hypothetical protein
MTALECTYDGCTAGEVGAKFKTLALAPSQSVTYLGFHREDGHGQRRAAAGGGAERVQLPKIPRPQISGSCSQEDFNFFNRKWGQYVRFSNEKDGNNLRDQLSNCPDETLRSVLYKALGDRIETISVTDLLKEIELLAQQAAEGRCPEDIHSRHWCTMFPPWQQSPPWPGAGCVQSPPVGNQPELCQLHSSWQPGFFAKVRGEHQKTEEVVESRTMVYVIEGDIILVSRAILETLGCIPKTFPQVGQFLTDDDDALTGRAFAVNPDPIGLRSDGTKDPNIPEAVATIVDPNMLTPAPMLPWPARPATRPARWVGQDQAR